MEIAEYRMENIEALWLLWLLPVVVGFYFWRFYRVRRVLSRFVQGSLAELVNGQVSTGRQVFKGVILLLSIVAIVIALTQPGWNPQPRQVVQKGRDIVLLIDVSRSMLAEDLYPSRLAHAKMAVKDLLGVLKGDRVGLIAFAGTTAVKCPLTRDYPFVSMAVEELNPDYISQGGTLIGDAIRRASEQVFSETEDRYRDIILITDGEDHDSFPLEAAKKAAEKDVRIFVIGIGDKIEGSRIPIAGAGSREYLKYEGAEVWTKLQDDSLKEIAVSTPGGAYWAYTPGTMLELDKIYSRMIDKAQTRDIATTDAVSYDEKFQIFLALALVLLFAEILVSERKRQ
ncbi:MAG: VWA domain-containing protein [Sedimentisphaerales bacterium]|nr:VWA domain-containing protein [Sedimentisphaerales bacterium]MBN2843733.1 VWA domain-containing protein [Sedimentisphaerales bacterium]